MKKLLILAILIASVTVIFALDSEPSEVVGYVKYELTANDFNMIAVPMNSGIANAIELATAISPDVQYIIKWDGGWVQYSTSTPDTSFEVTDGESFLVYLGGTEPVDFYCAGDLPTQANYDFVANDFNQIMLPLNRSDITNTIELANSISEDVAYIITWDGGWVQYSASTPDTSFDINIGDGFLVFTNAEVTGWNAPASKNVTRRSARALK